MKLVTLLENTACREGVRSAHGLSLYLETPRHRLLFDMGPNAAFAENAEALGVDLRAVDTAIVSHGHYDHGGGLAEFLKVNDHAPVFLHAGALGSFWARKPGGGERFIGLDPALREYVDRFRLTDGVMRIDGELTLFDGVADRFGGLDASAALMERLTDGTFRRDEFAHEQDLLVTAEGKSILIAGCAHRGVVNIRNRAETLLGRPVDVIVGGFHLFELPPGDPDTDALIGRTARALTAGSTVFYTGHCTGEYAFEKMSAVLGGRLRRISCGSVTEL